MSGRMVWLASYPKSGNTWLRSVYTALVQGDVDINALMGAGLAAARAFVEVTLGVRTADLTHDEVDLLRPLTDDAAAERLREDRWRKIHDALLPGPGGCVVSPGATRAALYIVRDPRDVAVSFAHHSSLSLEASVAYMADPGAAFYAGADTRHIQVRQRLGTWSQHVLSWAGATGFPVHVLRYEDCAERPVEAFGQAFAAAGLERTEAEVAAAVDKASLGRLQAQETEVGFRERAGREVRFFRRGRVGSWREELPAHLARRVERDHAAVMERFGYLP